KCDKDILKATFKNISIKENNSNKIKLTTSLRGNIQGNEIVFEILETNTNLSEEFARDLDVDFDLVIPPLKVRVNGIEVNMPMDHLKEKILGEKEFLAVKTINFAAEYLTGDLKELLNLYFKKVKIPTGFGADLVSTDYSLAGDFTPNYDIPNTVKVDKTYVDLPYYQERLPLRTEYKYMFEKGTNKVEKDTVTKQLLRLVGDASFQIELSNLYTSFFDKSVNAKINGNLVVRGRSLTFPTKIRQRRYLKHDYDTNEPEHMFKERDGYYVYKTELREVKFNNPLNRKYGMALAISDPIINSILDMAKDNRLFTKAFRQQVGVKSSGISVTDVHFHTQTRRKDGTSYYRPKIFIVTQIKVDVGSVYTTKWYEWLGKKVGGALEGNVYFPLQFEITPKLEVKNGVTQLKLVMKNPLDSNNDPKNYFNYYSDFDEDNIYGVVKTQFRKQLGISLRSSTKPIYIDLNEMLGKSGVNLRPVDVDVEKSGHIVLYVELDSINYNKLQGKK
ncbi:hypothetical protein N9B72_02380, partial [Bacteriovoracaceae bacterium]|nr:hypothetical protein [Bacteriovoracaceae bacterium]